FKYPCKGGTCKERKKRWQSALDNSNNCSNSSNSNQTWLHVLTKVDLAAKTKEKNNRPMRKKEKVSDRERERERERERIDFKKRHKIKVPETTLPALCPTIRTHTHTHTQHVMNLLNRRLRFVCLCAVM